MAETISLMDVDKGDNDTIPKSSIKPNKGKNVVVPGDGKSTLWVEKYHPQSLADVAAHRDIIDTIDRLTSENKLPHLLLYGPPRTGKTSTILAVARKLSGNQFHNMISSLMLPMNAVSMLFVSKFRILPAPKVSPLVQRHM